MMYDNDFCSGDPRSGSVLMSPEFTLLSDKMVTFTMAPHLSSNCTVNVYKTSISGYVDTLLRSIASATSPSIDANITYYDNVTYDHELCLPAGTYRLAFIGSEVESNRKSTAALTKVLLSDTACVYVHPARAAGKSVTNV